jgi:hypothetical protein
MASIEQIPDAGIEASHDRKLGVLLLSPEWGYKSRNRLYCYKLDEYRESMENVRTDIPHRTLTEIADALLGVGWVSLEFAASTIHRKAMELGLVSKEDVREFYEQRRIPLSI